MPKLVAVLTWLCLFTLALAADKPDKWPQKGDTVFVSAELVYASPRVLYDAPVESPIPACISMLVRKFKTKKPTWIITPSTGFGSVRLDGNWWTRFHSDEPECEKYLAAHGQPKFTRLNWIHTASHK